MLPAEQLEVVVAHDRLVPCFFTEADHPWLRELLAVYEACTGLPHRVLRARLAGAEAHRATRAGRARACATLDGLFKGEVDAPLPPPELRAVLFAEGAASSRAVARSRASERLGLAPEALERYLFADLPGERLVRPPSAPIAPSELAARANAALAASLVGRARRVIIRAFGSARDVVRYARLRGLLCTVDELGAPEAYELEVSGPYALFRRTTVYGRALASLVPRLAWCERFELDAEVAVGERSGLLRLATGDPIVPSAPPRRFDSKLEERFARDFVRATADYRLVREPAPFRSGEGLVFPDFAIVPTAASGPIAFLEIVGFSTEDYLARKLASLERARIERLILCVDVDRACGDGSLPRGAQVVGFRRRVDVQEVLRALSEMGPAVSEPRRALTPARARSGPTR